MTPFRALAPVGLALLVACGDDTTSGTDQADTGSSSTDPTGGGSTSADPTNTGPTDTTSSTTTLDTSTTTPDETGTTEPEDTSTSAATSESTSTDESTDDSTGAVTCDANEFGPECLPCTCINGACDDGSDGSGACTCEDGWAGDACDALDCGPGGAPDGGGGCTTPLVAIEDAQVVSDEFADNNYGDDSFTLFGVGQQNDFTGNQVARALLKFDLAVLPATAVVDTASLEIKEYDNFAGFPMTLAAKAATNDWAEIAVTWNSQPEVSATTLDTAVVGCCGESHVLDVTSAVLESIDAAETETTIELQSDDEGVIGGVRWFMREGDGVMLGGITGEPPTLVVHWTVQ